MKKLYLYSVFEKCLAILCLVTLTLLASACHKKVETVEDALTLKFDFEVDGLSFVPDSAGYVNAAGNTYEVQEIKFFISDVRLIKKGGGEVKITDNESVHYVDYGVPATLSWALHEPLPTGDYEAITFTFGLSERDNVSHRFPNPPESNMSWPAPLGGGYHYMQINGKWLSAGTMKPFNFHTGIGQLYDTLGQVTEYVHNDFTVTVPTDGLYISTKPLTVTLRMNINNWFTSPHDYNFEVWGGSIMQNQEAQQVIKENGHDVFQAVFTMRDYVNN